MLTVPSAVALAGQLRPLRSEPAFANISSALALTASGTWLVVSLLFGARLCSEFDFRPLLTLPLSFRRLFAVRCAAGLSGRA
jgi:hypothetical protein